MNNKLQTFVLASTLALLSFANSAMAGQALSWNLSRDMMNGIATNPKGVWAFMQNAPGNDDPANYTLLPTYCPAPCESYPAAFWRDPSSAAGISITKKTYVFSGYTLPKGIPHAHPGTENQVIFRWRSPISGTISLLGRVSDISPACGDGVTWYLKNGSATLLSGVLPNGTTGSTFVALDLPVTKATRLYFIIDKSANYFCDSTNLDMLITSQQ